MIEASIGDTVVINLTNKLGNETTGMHFHGINQINSNFMDGAVGSSQCPLPPDYTMSYSFTANEAGTYWYHSHNMGQYPDGFRGPLVVHNPQDPYLHDYDEDVVLTVSDWYRSQSPALVSKMLQPNNTGFQPPRPNSVIVNEGSDGHIPISPGKTYRMRLINFSAMTAAFVVFNALQMQIIMVDGTYIKKEAANQLRILAAQRYDVLITVGDSDKQNYPFLVALDTNADYTAKNASPGVGYHTNFTGQLANDYDGNLEGRSVVETFYPHDDSLLVPLDEEPAFGPVAKQWVLNFDYCHDANGYPRACFNGKTFIDQRVPTLYSVVSLGGNNTEVSAYGQVGAFAVGYGEVLEIVINNRDAAIHPFHLHGHQFQVIERPRSNAGNWTGTKLVPATPVRRDTVAVFANSYVVLRIVADNPGVFLLHCHIEWHVEMGLSATLIEAPERLVNYTIPQDHINVCNAQGIPVAGNAAGNELWYDTEGFVTINPTSYVGALYYDADAASVSASTPSSSVTPTPTSEVANTLFKRRRQRGIGGRWLE
ncbi:putative iron transport multicopper oxidase FET3 [Rosellinia necatrix]|uniref:Putative iron transport multicopper oxidase FET3 n=1 Tax=Rosellinia necatrix TaxID=77044 RepID=A0A1S7UIU2_ROSNE|nr:putative iron transport multicopper oxidase FET3 [Rosellinia necatrix]